MTTAQQETKFKKVLTAQGFTVCRIERSKPNRFKPSSLTDEFLYEYTDVTARRHTVLVVVYPDGKAWWVYRYKQTNGIEAPTHGDNANQLRKALLADFGIY